MSAQYHQQPSINRFQLIYLPILSALKDVTPLTVHLLTTVPQEHLVLEHSLVLLFIAQMIKIDLYQVLSQTQLSLYKETAS